MSGYKSLATLSQLKLYFRCVQTAYFFLKEQRDKHRHHSLSLICVLESQKKGKHLLHVIMEGKCKSGHNFESSSSKVAHPLCSQMEVPIENGQLSFRDVMWKITHFFIG